MTKINLLATKNYEYMKNKIAYILTAIVVLLVTVCEWKDVRMPYLYKSSVSFLAETKKYANTDCLYIFDRPWKSFVSYKDVSNYRSVTFLQDKKLDRLRQLDIANEKKLIVIQTKDNKDVLEKIMSEYPQLSQYKLVGKFVYKTYYLYGDEHKTDENEVMQTITTTKKL